MHAGLAPDPGRSIDDERLAALALLERRVQWLSMWTIHNANHIRPSRDGLKVGGHQASCASMTAIMTALYFHTLRPQDRVAVKPHASPVFHAIQYLLGNQTRDQLERFRALGGAQSYPSRTKDKDDVDFSTGSVGLGVAVTAFAALVQDYVRARNWLPESDMGRMIAVLGDAELDEGNIYEALLESYRHDVRNVWWIVDYNRQSLDAITAERMFTRFDEIFRASGWEVVVVKYGKKLEAAFARPGGPALRRWIDECPNALYAALTYQGGAAWRRQLLADIGREAGAAGLVGAYDDAALAALMTDLGGHCLATLTEAFAGARDDRPRLFIAYTIKGRGLPFQGHKDNHAGLMTPAQMDAYRAGFGIAPGAEWEPFAGLTPAETLRLQTFLKSAPLARAGTRRKAAAAAPPPDAASFPRPAAESDSTQAVFGKILNELGRRDDDFAARIVTTSPDVTVSTNLGGWVNRRAIFSRVPHEDAFAEAKVVSAQKWVGRAQGQHIELGIAENNLFLMLAALGLSSSLFGARLLPVGTLYDPFIARGLDALNYACYQDARFLLVATPSGLTLAPEGGAHQSINPPLIGMAQPGLTAFEPAYGDELSEIMRWAFAHMQAAEGGSVYLRLSTRPLEQPNRPHDPDWAAAVIDGAYWMRPPAQGAELAIVYAGAVAPEAAQAHALVREDVPGAGLLAVTSPGRLHADWAERGFDSSIARLLEPLAPNARLVTVLDGAPGALSWLGAVRGHPVAPLGVTAFGQSGDVPDLYRIYRLDAEAIVDACAKALLLGVKDAAVAG